MKPVSIRIASLALPSSLVFAQATTPTTGGSSLIPYIPLIGTAGSTGTAGGAINAMTWLIDVANSQVVACAQPVAATTGTTAQGFTCASQTIPVTSTATSGITPSSGTAPGAVSGTTQ